MVIKIGTCGWSRLYQAFPPSKREGKTNLEVYSETYPIVEVNSSFYDFHRVSTYKKWRKETREDFEFTLKAHQSISHEGSLKPSEEVIENFNKMLERGKALGADVMLIQTPAGLEAEENVFKRANKFFNEVDTDSIQLAWETRGDSWENADGREKLRKLLEKHNIIHVADPFKIKPVNIEEFAYFRLHGLPEYNLKYKYTNQHLEWLNRQLEEYNQNVTDVLIFFNNYAMYKDAQRLLKLREKGELPESPFGPETVKETLSTYEGWPSKKEELIDDCGNWFCWIEPNTSVRLNKILEYFDERVYRTLEEVEKEAKKIWDKTGYPASKDVEEKALRNLKRPNVI